MQFALLPPALLALLPLASAGGYSYGSGSGSGTTSAGSSAASQVSSVKGVHIVNVGQNGLTMSPNDITVPVGETIEFHFFTGAHSVAQSAFATPCTPLVNGTTVGFFSGSIPVTSGESSNVFSVVSDGQPMWYYCATGRHCQSGMVGVINKPASGQRTIDQYKAAAAKAAQNVEPSAVRGGTIGAAAASTASGSAPTSSQSGTTGGSGTSAGVSAHGGLNLGMLALTLVAAGFFGGLLM